jgi:hypothetical protein
MPVVAEERTEKPLFVSVERRKLRKQKKTIKALYNKRGHVSTGNKERTLRKKKCPT